MQGFQTYLLCSTCFLDFENANLGFIFGCMLSQWKCREVLWHFTKVTVLQANQLSPNQPYCYWHQRLAFRVSVVLGKEAMMWNSVISPAWTFTGSKRTSKHRRSLLSFSAVKTNVQIMGIQLRGKLGLQMYNKTELGYSQPTIQYPIQCILFYPELFLMFLRGNMCFR